MKAKLAKRLVITALVISIIFLSGCTEAPSIDEDIDAEGIIDDVSEEIMGDSEEDDESEPLIDPEDFVGVIDNPYFPLAVGTTFIYEGVSDGEDVRVELYVTDQTKEIMGVTTTVIREREWEDGELVEDTFDWYAQDEDGNVWYFGEDTKEYEDGEVVSTAGSWEGGVDGAEPGILVKGDPQVGDIYQQEYYEGEAEDMAEVLSLTESVTVGYGSFDNCLQTREWTPLEPAAEENKYYAMDVGLLLEVATKGGESRVELIDITTE
ncbi:hypothetical protein V7O66_11460 [Methanolobus sp. ZRKC3]|uniref:hypothetical protein n=1 Tax=Methanolobus sp. ZRKC3 TaxID=3125786 RepID=UPI00324BAE2C